MSDPKEIFDRAKYAEFDYHGGPFDRGSADSYYHRARDPHYYPNGTYNGERIGYADMTKEEREAYEAGYDWNEEMGDKKDWGGDY
jgi:CRISPR/Cas system-associated protein Cas5 (RAMP superfamily)